MGGGGGDVFKFNQMYFKSKTASCVALNLIITEKNYFESKLQKQLCFRYTALTQKFAFDL